MSTPKKHHIAARMGHWSATHRKTAIFGWLGFVIVAFAIGTFVVTQQQIVYETSQPGESGRAEKILYEDFKQPAGESILIQHPELRATNPAFQAVVRDVVSSAEEHRRCREGRVTARRRELRPGLRRQTRGAGRAGDRGRVRQGDRQDRSGRRADQGGAERQPGLLRRGVGVSTEKDVQEAFFEDLAKAGLISIPITLIILIVAFGALVAAGIPLLLGITAILATMGLISIWSQWLPMEEAVGAMVLLIGLAVGVDYSMFYLKREREERAKGRSEEAALEAAAATSGRSVLISGLTVLVAMSGMFLTGDATFASFGIATMTVVAIAMLGSLTVLPAVLSKLGDKVDRGRVPFVHRLSRKDGEGRIWGAIIDRVLKRPVISVVLSAGLLIALAIPAIQLRTAQPSFDTFPQNLLTTYNRLKEAFPGTEISATVVVKAPNVEAPEVQEAIGQLQWRAIDSGVMNDPIDVDVNAAKTVATVAIPIEGDGTDATSKLALTTLRDEIVPVTVGTLAGAEVGVTGTTAQSEDFNAQMSTAAPLVFAFVLIFAFLLMLVSFRSIVIATKAVLLNLLSVGAAYGILVLVFQHGYGKQLLGFEVTGGIDPFLPVLLFVILFGLSMDYHVFILSRIREGYDSGMPTEAAISHGIKSTAGVVTSAAIVMVAVFSVFGALQAMIFKQFGVGLASAILIDATIVRAVLLPATMKLLGDWNWYLPKWLEWLPHFEHGEKLEPVEAPPVPTA